MIDVFVFVIVSFFVSILLTLFSYYLNKDEDLKIKKIKDMLPGYNCGACGFSGCEEMAKNLVNDNKLLSKCKPIKKEEYNKLMDYLSKSGK